MRPRLCAAVALCLMIFAAGPGGCDRAPLPSRTVVRPTVASLVPSATDLLVAMGAADHLVAVCTFDNTDRPELAGLPRAGDYQNVDWERISALRPDLMIVFQAPDRLPAGLKEKADALGIRLVNVRTETLDDIYAEALKLGSLIDEPDKAQATIAQLRAQLETTRMRVAGMPLVRTLLVTDDGGTAVAGHDTFLNDLLTIAGGENVLSTGGWLTIDRERLLALRPDAVIVLLSDVSPQVEAEARRIWRGLEQLPAVRNQRVYFINRWYALQSGFHVGDLAALMADALHPAPLPSDTPPSSPQGTW